MRGIAAQLEVRVALDQLDRVAVRSWSSDHTPGLRQEPAAGCLLPGCAFELSEGFDSLSKGRIGPAPRRQQAQPADMGAQCFFLNRRYRAQHRTWSSPRAISWWPPAASTSCSGSSTRSWAAPPKLRSTTTRCSSMPPCWATSTSTGSWPVSSRSSATWDPATGRGVYDVVPAETMDRATLAGQASPNPLRRCARAPTSCSRPPSSTASSTAAPTSWCGRPDGSYAVFDTKLARHAKVTALLQLAAYGDQLLKAGITAGSGGDPGPRRHGAAPRRRLRLRPQPPQTLGDPAGLPRAPGPLPRADRRRTCAQPGTVALGRARASPPAAAATTARSRSRPPTICSSWPG